MAEQVIDEATRADWERDFDGYEMVWTFVNPAVEQGDQNIDAACILGATANLVD